MMPISPNHLLYTRVGSNEECPARCSLEMTRCIQRIYAETALRSIFGTAPYPWVEQVRPRVVNAAQFKDEQEQWRDWHENQSASESH